MPTDDQNGPLWVANQEVRAEQGPGCQIERTRQQFTDPGRQGFLIKTRSNFFSKRKASLMRRCCNHLDRPAIIAGGKCCP